MGRLQSWGLTAIAAAVVGAAILTDDRPVIYTVPEQGKCMADGKTAEECCVNINGCGNVCYKGMEGGMFRISVNGDQFIYSTADPEMRSQECRLRRGNVSSGELIVIHME